MATNSISFPHIFDVARNRVGILNDNVSIVNRTRLLILTEPTEIYDNPDQGVGLKQHIWKYNNANVAAQIQDKIKEQLKKHEPCVDSEKTSFSDGLLFTGGDESSINDFNELKMTIGLQTVFGDNLEVTVNE